MTKKNQRYEKDLDLLLGKVTKQVFNFLLTHKLSRREQSELLEYIGIHFNNLSEMI